MTAFKKIKDYTPEELNDAIERAKVLGAELKLDCDWEENPFFTLLRGIDAYFERRRRKEEIEAKPR